MKEETQNIDFILVTGNAGQIHQVKTESKEGRRKQGFGVRKSGMKSSRRQRKRGYALAKMHDKYFSVYMNCRL